MDFSIYFPVWNQLTKEQKQKIERAAYERNVPGGMILHSGETNCLGIVLVQKGQLRAYSISNEGREVTLYRLFERDVCIFTASCAMPNIMFDMVIEAEKDSELMIIPPDVYQEVLSESAPLANYHNEVISSRFSDVMWMMEQIMWKSFDKRLAAFLLEESTLDGTDHLKITHEKIANHMGTAREVVTRMLKYFQNEGMVKLARGTVELTDRKKLYELQNA